MMVVIDNASMSTARPKFLATRPALHVDAPNPENRACAAAWNQGFQASSHPVDDVLEQ